MTLLSRLVSNVKHSLIVLVPGEKGKRNVWGRCWTFPRRSGEMDHLKRRLLRQVP